MDRDGARGWVADPRPLLRICRGWMELGAERGLFVSAVPGWVHSERSRWGPATRGVFFAPLPARKEPPHPQTQQKGVKTPVEAHE